MLQAINNAAGNVEQSKPIWIFCLFSCFGLGFLLVLFLVGFVWLLLLFFVCVCVCFCFCVCFFFVCVCVCVWGGGGGGGRTGWHGRDRDRENSTNLNTLIYKDCSLGSVKNLSNN